MSPEQTARWLLAHDGYLILTHRRPDGDTIGSAAAGKERPDVFFNVRAFLSCHVLL